MRKLSFSAVVGALRWSRYQGNPRSGKRSLAQQLRILKIEKTALLSSLFVLPAYVHIPFNDDLIFCISPHDFTSETDLQDLASADCRRTKSPIGNI